MLILVFCIQKISDLFMKIKEQLSVFEKYDGISFEEEKKIKMDVLFNLSIKIFKAILKKYSINLHIVVM